MDTRNQHRHIAALQEKWASDALRDARYNLQRATIEKKAGNLVLARGYMKEYNVDLYWAARRKKVAAAERKRY